LPAKPAWVIAATATISAVAAAASAARTSHRRSRTFGTSASSAPTRTGTERIVLERRNTSRNGYFAKAGESGFGWRARLAARSQSPDPQYSGANQRKPQSTNAPPTTARRRGSV
jgi:hypothetical protein